MYPKWVGVVLGFLLNGSAHFLSGKYAVESAEYTGPCPESRNEEV